MLLGRYREAIVEAAAQECCHLEPSLANRIGLASNHGKRKQATFVYQTATLDAVIWGAELAVGAGQGRICILQPTGSIDDDANLTNMKFQGNPTKSHRARNPLRIISEVTDWKGDTPDWRKCTTALRPSSNVVLRQLKNEHRSAIQRFIPQS
jgi:hypothetical protein